MLHKSSDVTKDWVDENIHLFPLYFPKLYEESVITKHDPYQLLDCMRKFEHTYGETIFSINENGKIYLANHAYLTHKQDTLNGISKWLNK